MLLSIRPKETQIRNELVESRHAFPGGRHAALQPTHAGLRNLSARAELFSRHRSNPPRCTLLTTIISSVHASPERIQADRDPISLIIIEETDRTNLAAIDKEKPSESSGWWHLTLPGSRNFPDPFRKIAKLSIRNSIVASAKEEFQSLKRTVFKLCNRSTDCAEYWFFEAIHLKRD